MKSNLLKLMGVALTAGTTAMAVAQQTAPKESGSELQEVVITGYRTVTTSSALKGNVNARDVPLTVSGYSDEFIKDVEVEDVDELYNYMTGVQRSGPTGYDISIRGFSSGGADRNSILIDGMPGLTVRFGSPPTVNTERVEVVKGPASVLYGQAQPGGFVNIITRKPSRKSSYSVGARMEGFNGADAKFGDTFGWTVNADATGAISDSLAYLLVAELSKRPGFVNSSFDDSTFISPALSIKAGDNTDVLIALEYRKEDVALYNGLVAFNNDINNVADIKTRYQEPRDIQPEMGYSGNITIDHTFVGGWNWRTAIRGVYHEDSAIGLENQAFRSATVLRRRVRDQFNIREYYFIDSNLSKDFEAGAITHHLMFGANGGVETSDFERRNFNQVCNAADINILKPVYSGLPTACITPIPDTWRYTSNDSRGVYLQDRVDLGERWKIVGALRWESFDITQKDRRKLIADQSVSDKAITSMVGLIYQPSTSWSIYASRATSFKAPATGAVGATGAPITEPEKGSQVEGGVKATLLDGRFNFTASIFDIKKDNVIQAAGAGVSVLSGGEQSKGYELEFDMRPIPNWNIIGGYTSINAEVAKDRTIGLIGQRLRNAPEKQASLYTRYTIEGGALRGVGVNFGISRVGDRFGTLPVVGSRLLLPAYTVVDAGLHYERDSWKTALVFKNLLDEKYYESAITNIQITPGSPRAVVLSVERKF
jgi:iron complex outermembrane receptor protein